MKETPNKIVFYDGDCGLCNRSVQFILKKERHAEIHFATLQSEFALNQFDKLGMERPDMSTFFYLEKGKMYQKSEAAFRTAGNLRFPFSILKSFLIFPQWLSDQVYNLLAKYRKKIAGNYCAVPNSKQKKRFIS